METIKTYSLWKVTLLSFVVLAFLSNSLITAGTESSGSNLSARPSYAKIPDDMPLNAVKWTGGFWKDRMQRLRDIYLPGVLDGSFMTVENGATFRNLLRAAGLEEGGALGCTWSDGDCYLVLDTAARLYAYQPDNYLKTKLDYWIPIIGRIQCSDGLVDSWTVLKGFDSKYGKRRQQQSEFQGLLPYNMGSLHVAATTYQRATGNDRFLTIADKAVLHWVNSGGSAVDPMQWAMAPLYSRTGDPRYLDALRRTYSDTESSFGPPIRVAPEVFGHNTATAHYLMGATTLCGFTGEKDLQNALVRLATNMLTKKMYITGAVAPVFRGQRPTQCIESKTYPASDMHEAIGRAYDLPNDSAYCESCGQALYMEWYYRMFRLTGEAVYMDAAERALYNTVPGCVDLDRPNFFYCNPQEQLSGSKRSHTDTTKDTWEATYTWRRQYTKKCACCPPKVMRAIAMSVEMAYNVNSEGLWVNLYGDNTARIELPDGGALECNQTSNYPWDGKVRLVLSKVKAKKPFSIFLRIPGWVDGSVRITLNGNVIQDINMSGTYYRFHRQWKSGDSVEIDMPMTVRFMTAHPNVMDDWGKIAVMRGPVVYCLEGCDIPEGITLEAIYVPSNAKLQPVFSEDLGGVMKLTGELVHSTTTTISHNRLVYDPTETALYREVRFEEDDKGLTGKDQYVTVSMVPYYTRLNRESDYFRIWLPVCGYKEVIDALVAKMAQLKVSDAFPYGTVLHYAAERGNMEMAESLVAKGADVNANNDNGQTPLHIAINNNYEDITDLLIAKGADINAVDSAGNTSLHRAVEEEQRDLVELLIDNGAEVKVKNHEGQTALHIIAAKPIRGLWISLLGGHSRNWYIAERLLSAGADVNARDNDGHTPLWHAKDKGNKDILDLLLQHRGIPDVAVLDVSAPSSCVKGDSIYIKVTVKNQSECNETIEVKLVDTTAHVEIGSQSVILSKGGIDTTVDVILDAEGTGVQQFGNYPRCGDVNGDGYDDLLVTAAYWNDDVKQGRVYLYFGSENGVYDKPDWVVTGENPGDYFGEGCAIGDINGDGYDDVVIGALGYDSRRGRAYIFLGGSDMDQKADMILEGEPGTTGGFGREVYVGRIDGDKYADVMVNANLYNSATGRIYLFYGGDPMDTLADKVIDGEGPGDRIGREGHIGRDVNGDGYGDILLGARAYNNVTGRAYLFYGGPSETMDTVCDKVFTGEAQGDMFGCDVCLADMDNDGFADVLIGSPGSASRGRVYLYWGSADMDTKPDLVLEGEPGANSNFGHHVEAGCFNADEYPDFVVGAFAYRYSNRKRGRVYLFYGNERATIDTTPDVVFTRVEPDSFFSTKNAIGDFNGDELADLYIAAAYYPNNTRQGRGYVYYNNPYPSKGTGLNWDTTNASIGKHTLKVEIPQVQGEKNTENNVKTITIEVTETTR